MTAGGSWETEKNLQGDRTKWINESNLKEAYHVGVKENFNTKPQNSGPQ